MYFFSVVEQFFQAQQMAKIWGQRRGFILPNFACCTMLLPTTELITINSFLINCRRITLLEEHLSDLFKFPL